jgi:DNA-3-methyladenine glycosylase I
MPSPSLVRCPWPGSDPLYLRYHDREWGVPLRNERALFEFLVLEGAQAGLSWITILRKRPAYRRAFARFDARAVAAFGARDARRLLADEGIVRNRMKIEAAIANARAVLAVREELGSLTRLVWSFTDGRPVTNHWQRMSDVPAATDASHAMSKELRRRGFRFVGPTICYAFMQAVGIVNDHLVDCYRHRELGRASLGEPRS